MSSSVSISVFSLGGCVRSIGHEHEFCQAHQKAENTDPRTNYVVKYATARGHLTQPLLYLRMQLFLLTVGSFLLTVELFSLQLTILAFLLTIGAFWLAALAFYLQLEFFFAYSGKVRRIRV